MSHNPLTAEDLASLEIGDMLEAEAFFPGLDKEEPLRLHVTERTQDEMKLTIVFVASIFGLFVGKWGVIATGDVLTWSKV